MAEVINKEQGLARLGGNMALYKKLLVSFTANTYIGQIKEELSGGDLDTAQKTVHTLKGVSANLSLDKINRYSVALELNLKNSEPYTENIEFLENSINETLTAIANLE